MCGILRAVHGSNTLVLALIAFEQRDRLPPRRLNYEREVFEIVWSRAGPLALITGRALVMAVLRVPVRQ